MKRWSKLKKRIDDLLIPGAEVRCSVYRMKSQRGTIDLPRICIAVDRHTIWDYPKDFIGKDLKGSRRGGYYPYDGNVNVLTGILHEYINTPKEEIRTRKFPEDRWGFVDLLKILDRRLQK